MAANLESMGKMDEALAMYQQIASAYPKQLRCAPGHAFAGVHSEGEKS